MYQAPISYYRYYCPMESVSAIGYGSICLILVASAITVNYSTRAFKLKPIFVMVLTCTITSLQAALVGTSIKVADSKQNT